MLLSEAPIGMSPPLFLTLCFPGGVWAPFGGSAVNDSRLTGKKEKD